CGQPADEFEPERHRFTWSPAWIILFIFLGIPGLLILLILASVLRKSRSIETPFCEDHRGYWKLRKWMNFGLLMSVFGTIGACVTLAIMKAEAWTFFAVIGTFLVLLIAAAVFSQRS